MNEYGLEGTCFFWHLHARYLMHQRIPNDILHSRSLSSTDDEPRWLIALISDTGMTGLAKKDFQKDIP